MSPLQPDPDLTAFVEAVAAELGTPGVSVGVLTGGKAFVATVGVTSTKDPLPVDEDTLFLIGSTTKTFTATAIMALVDKGVLSLEDRVANRLPGFRLQDARVAETLTILQLLNHTSGFRGDLHPNTGWGDDALERALESLATAPQELKPGTVASYSNAGFLIAGHLLSLLHGTPFETALRELVLEPLGLSSTMSLPWEVVHHRHAVAHLVSDERVATALPAYLVHRSLGPAGGLWSSLRDQVAYARYHLDGTTAGTAPVREVTRLAMQQPTVAARSTIDGIGLSWLLGHRGDVRLVSHGGNISNGQTSTFTLAPDHGFALTAMTNSKHGTALGEKVLAWALDQYLGLGAPPHLPTVPFVAEELAGLYDLGPFGYLLTAVGDKLMVEITVPDDVPETARLAFLNAPRELVAVAPDVFALAASPVTPVLDVRRAADGTVEGIVHGMRFARRVPPAAEGLLL